MIELSPDEEVSSVVVGNSAAWQVTSSQRGDRVVVKPLSGAAATNMVIVTDVRRYLFLLQPAQGGASSVFVYRFVYPSAVPVELTASPSVAQYKFRGSKDLFPLIMRDDGVRTTVTWDVKTALPAIFIVDEQGREAIVNGRMVDGEYVIEGTARRFIFRRGRPRAVATRKALRVRQ